MSIEFKELVVGMVVYECEGGENIKMTIKSIKDTGKGYEVIGVTDKGTEITLYQSHTNSAYGPWLYKEPQYIRIKDGVVTYNNIEV